MPSVPSAEPQTEFLERPIEGEINYLFLDASYFKVRSEGRYITKALLFATGIHKNGCREILGAKVAANEDEPAWDSLFAELKDRGLKGVKLVISDGHKGIQKAVEKAFLGSSWQMCAVHFMRAVLKNIPKKNKMEVAYELRDALEEENRMQMLANRLEQEGYHKSAETIERFACKSRLRSRGISIFIPLRMSLVLRLMGVSDMIYGITEPFRECIGNGSGQPMDWKGSTRN